MKKRLLHRSNAGMVTAMPSAISIKTNIALTAQYSTSSNMLTILQFLPAKAGTANF